MLRRGMSGGSSPSRSLWWIFGFIGGAACGGLVGALFLAPETGQRAPIQEALHNERTPLVCTRGPAKQRNSSFAVRGEDDECAENAFWTDLLEQRLAACEAQRTRIRHGWVDDGPAVEEPSAWSEVVENAVLECDLPAEIEAIECTEYPCVAALRPSASLVTAEPSETLDYIQAAVDGCAPLRSAFSVRPDEQGALQIHELEIACSEGAQSEKAYVLVALDTAGDAWRKFNERDKDVEELMRWYFRRTDDLAAIWQCQEPGAEG